MKTKRTLLAVVATLFLGALAEAQEPQIELDIDLLKKTPKDTIVWLQKAVDLQGVTPSSHWMGVVVRPVDPLLKKHLRLDGGLIVQHVTQDSPAAEAGIQADDILLAINDTTVADFKGLMEFLTENKDEEATLWYLRDGKKQSVKVTPTKRPDGHEKFFTPPKIGEAIDKFDFQGMTPEEIRKWIEEVAKKSGAGQPWKFDGENPLKLRFFHPGVILGNDVEVDVDIDLPKGLQVMVIKQGDEPAKIKVKRGDDEWEVTEKELDQLPEDIRAHVKKYLGKGTRLGIRVEAPRGLQAKPLDSLRVPRVQARAIQIDGGLNKKLDEINERLEKIEQALQKLAE